MKSREIERRWLLEGLPMELSALPAKRIVQVYTKIEDEETIRYRKTTDGDRVSYTRTAKIPIAYGECEEDETTCSADDFSTALVSGGPYIIKDRYLYPWGGYVFEIDVYEIPIDHARKIGHGHDTLVIMEVELPSIDTPIQLPRLSVGPVEITGDKKYSNAGLAKTFAEMRGSS